MFTTKYWKNAPKPKRRVKKFEEGGLVDDTVDTNAEPDNSSDESVEKADDSNPFNAKKWEAVSKATKGIGGGDAGRKRSSSSNVQAKPFRTDY